MKKKTHNKKVAARKAKAKAAAKEQKMLRLFFGIVIIHHPQLVFDMPGTWGQKISKLWVIYKGLTNPKNTFFNPQPTDPDPAQFKQMIEDLEIAHKEVATKTGTTDTRDNFWNTAYFNGVKNIMAYAQQIYYKNPDLANSVATAIGLKLRKPTQADIDDFTVQVKKNGTVKLVSKRNKKTLIFQWQGTRTPEDKRSWAADLDILPSKTCKTDVPNLAEGMWYFRMRKIFDGNTATEWSSVISVYVMREHYYFQD